MRKKKKIVFLVVGLLTVYVVAYFIDYARYKSTGILQCSEEQKIEVSRAKWPVLSKFNFTTGIEVYVGGWLETGTLSLAGTPFRSKEFKSYEAREGLIEVSRSHFGEWYSENFTINFKPSPGASCALRIVYKFKGI